MIAPTVGRILWYYPAKGERIAHDFPEPLAATVCAIQGNGTVNLCVFDADGVPHPRQSVVLIQDGKYPANGAYPYCEWMPYQKGQAAKTEHAEAVNQAIIDSIRRG